MFACASPSRPPQALAVLLHGPQSNLIAEDYIHKFPASHVLWDDSNGKDIAKAIVHRALVDHFVVSFPWDPWHQHVNTILTAKAAVKGKAEPPLAFGLVYTKLSDLPNERNALLQFGTHLVGKHHRTPQTLDKLDLAELSTKLKQLTIPESDATVLTQFLLNSLGFVAGKKKVFIEPRNPYDFVVPTGTSAGEQIAASLVKFVASKKSAISQGNFEKLSCAECSGQNITSALAKGAPLCGTCLHLALGASNLQLKPLATMAVPMTPKMTKAYSSSNFVATQLISHSGTLVAFGMDSNGALYYAPLDMNDGSKGELDVDYWPAAPSPVPFPPEVTRAGFAVAGTMLMPTVKLGTGEEDTAGTLDSTEIDPFLSSTARLTQPGYFAVYSDNQHIYLFRQSVSAASSRTVYALANGNTGQGNRPLADYALNANNQKVSVVDGNLLVDRFLLSGTRLVPAIDVRYRRSRNKDVPNGPKDTLGTEDMDGTPFLEPTQILSFLRGSSSFTALLLPTSVTDLQQWQFFLVNKAVNCIDIVGVERGSDGYFNTRGSIFYTSPDPKYASAVFERSPGTCPFTNVPLIPIDPVSRAVGTCINLDGASSLSIPSTVSKTVFSVRLWIKASQSPANAQVIFSCAAFSLKQTGTTLVLSVPNNSSSTLSAALAVGKWTGVYIIYGNIQVAGQPNAGKKMLQFGTTDIDTQVAFPTTVPSWTSGTLGASTGGFIGSVDELAIFASARAASDVRAYIRRRYSGLETDLSVYYNFDEANGSKVYDSTPNATAATISGMPTWQLSDAPIGSSPGLRYARVWAAGFTLQDGIDAALYNQQEQQIIGADGVAAPVQTQTRILVAAPVSHAGMNDTVTAVLDLAVAMDGTLAAVPQNVTLPERNFPTSATDEIADLENAMSTYRARLDTLDRFIIPPYGSTVQNGITPVQGAIVADDVWSMWVDGVLVSSSSFAGASKSFDLSDVAFQPGSVVAVDAANIGGPSGLIGSFVTSLGRLCVTGKKWKASLTAPANWNQKNFDDSGWASADVLGPNGGANWAPTVVPGVDATANWIWLGSNTVDNKHVYFRYKIPGGTVDTPGGMIADDYFTVWVNGTKVKDTGSLAAVWDCSDVDFPPGAVIAIDAWNAGGPAGLLASFTTTTGRKVLTDYSWRASLTAPTNWNQPNFDDSNWDFAVHVAKNQTGATNNPWGKQPNIDETAFWIWLGVNTEVRHTYFRFTIPYGSVPTAPSYVCCDDYMNMWVDGYPVLKNWVWDSVRNLSNVSFAPGSVIAIEAWNVGGPAGIMGNFTNTLGRKFTTGTKWRATSTLFANWNLPNFDDSSWGYAIQSGSNGGQPWNSTYPSIDSGTPAIWFGSPTAADPYSYPANVRLYFRLIVPPGIPTPGGALSDDAFILYVDGIEKTRGTLSDGVVDLSHLNFPPGSLVAVDSWNYSGPSYFMASFTTTQGRRCITNQSWKASLTNPSGWNTRAFNDSAWLPADILTLNPSIANVDSYACQIWLGSNTEAYKHVYFRFVVPPGSVQTPTRFWCDDVMSVWVDGQPLAKDFPFTKFLDLTNVTFNPGSVICIEAYNTGGPAGILGQITSVLGRRIYTDAKWKASMTFQDGWNQPSFNDFMWNYATEVAPATGPPWNWASPAGVDTAAKWIWIGDNYVVSEKRYFRYTVPPGVPTWRAYARVPSPYTIQGYTICTDVGSSSTLTKVTDCMTACTNTAGCNSVQYNDNSGVCKPQKCSVDIAKWDNYGASVAGPGGFSTFLGPDLWDALQQTLLVSGQERAMVAGLLSTAQARYDQIKNTVPGTRVQFPLSLIAVDSRGLSVAGAVMPAAPVGGPSLFNSALGQCVMYHKGADGSFSALAFSPTGTRARFILPADDAAYASVVLEGRHVGEHLNSALVTIGDAASTDLCILTITTPTQTEIWTLPRASDQWSAILAGNAAPPVPALASPALVNLTYGSTLFTADSSGGPVKNGTFTLGKVGSSPAFVPDTPGAAYYFNGSNTLLSLPNIPGVTNPDGSWALTPWRNKYPLAQENWSVELWLNPETVVSRARLLTCSVDPNERPSGGLFTVGINPASVMCAAKFTGGQGISILPADDLNVVPFTIELWCRVEEYPAAAIGSYFVFGGARSMQLSLTQGGALLFTHNGASVGTVDAVFLTKRWVHVALVHTGSVMQIVVNGKLTVTKSVAGTSAALPVSETIYIAAKPSGISGASLEGQVEALRIWNYARQPADIAAMMTKSLVGHEFGLVALYTFVSGLAGDVSGRGHAGAVVGSNFTPMESGMTWYTVFGGTPVRTIATTQAFTAGSWTHVNVSHQQAYALKLTGGASITAGNAEGLNLVDELTIEVGLLLHGTGTTHNLIARGQRSTPYHFFVTPDSRLSFYFVDGNGASQTFTSSAALSPGFHKVAVVRAKVVQKNEQTTQVNGQNVVSSVSLDQLLQISFYIDGNDAGSYRFSGQVGEGNDGTVTIGSAATPLGFQSICATISDLRVWSVARAKAQLGGSIDPLNAKGLAAWWTFQENRGSTAFDAVSENHGKLKKHRWVKTPDPTGSSLVLTCNGVVMATQRLTDVSWPSGTYFNMGALGAGSELYQGVLEEVRVWNNPRTLEQIMDNMFTRVKGERTSLLAYYPFDDSSTAASSTRLADNSLLGNHLYWTASTRPQSVLSSAPVSTDTSVVRAVGAVRTSFNESISSAPSVGEYADLQNDGRGNLSGVMKRCYSYTQAGEWFLVTGYKVGAVITEWVGQAQFAPQLIGYIEGPPPVPSENLTIDAKDDVEGGDNSVTLQTADSVTATMGSSTEGSSSFGLKMRLSANFGTDDMIIVAPLGFGVAKSATKVNGEVGLSAGLNLDKSWSQEQTVASTNELTRQVKASLQGYWENPAGLRNATLGQRYVPRNYGTALVQSSTADVFSLRLEHNRALVGYRMRPNPDIPPDWNLIPFAINPRYTKNGTLDGRVGFDTSGGVVMDEDYAGSTGYGEYSYYKPREAYALKNQILRQQQRLAAVYANYNTDAPLFNAGNMGNALKVMAKGAPDFKPPLSVSKPTTDYSKRNLCNTYVWTADGGFFSESTQLSDTFSETTAGTWSMSGELSLDFSLNFTIFSIGAHFELDASVGGGYSVTRTKTKESTRSFGVDIALSVPGRRNMQQILNGKPVFNGTKPVWQPGKVDAYRFNTYYLEPQTRNFEDFFNKVVDPIWLKSSDPNALALQQANQATTKPPCWRIFHRVTFVSRILPPVINAALNPPLEVTMKTINIDSNWELLQRLTPVVSDKVNVADFVDAIRNYLQANLPQLLPHLTRITQLTADYLGFNIS
eukprot:TRINITY_DN5596_c0_g2_i2.p1 TRINITY_DN5596_c0_g2~~TRINITY_DN5596_c0_g2_i2.p1  ORF type:complete len:3298 (+),score=520.94 TRINITY_DN5596_c0_g2_i2:1286-11179(+)